MITEKQYIICSAVHVDDGRQYISQPKNIKSGFVMCGRRHHNVLNLLHQLDIQYDKKNTTQGFLTSDDMFVDRQEALRIAKQCKQLASDRKIFRLTSEDIY